MALRHNFGVQFWLRVDVIIKIRSLSKVYSGYGVLREQARHAELGTRAPPLRCKTLLPRSKTKCSVWSSAGPGDVVDTV